MRKADIGIALAINFLKLLVRIVTGQKLVQERTERNLLSFGHVLQRTGSNILRLATIKYERILMQEQAKIVERFRNLHDDHRPVRGLKLRGNAFTTR